MSDHPIPVDLFAERATLGSLLLERDAILAVSDTIQPDDFYLEKHGLIYQAALVCLTKRVPPDLATVADELRRHNQLEQIGGIAFLAELVSDVPTAVHVDYYAAIVMRTAILRRLITSGGAIVALGYNEQQDLDSTLDVAEQKLFAVTRRRRGPDFVPLRQAVQAYFDRIQRDEDELVVPTGLTDLDVKLNGGLRPGQLVLLAARPGVGKTGLALSIAYHLGVTSGRSVGIISLEMGRNELVQRLIAQHTGVDTRQIDERARRGNQQVLDALGVLTEAAIAIEDSSMLSVLDVRSKARRLAMARPLDLLIIDYLQLLISDTKAKNRVDEVSMISRQLKLLARELNCPVLALSQLSRAVEQRGSKVPQLSDLRDSGSLEQDADIVLFIYREQGNEQSAQGSAEVTELYLAKQRSGPVGIVPVQFDPPTTRFRDVSRTAPRKILRD